MLNRLITSPHRHLILALGLSLALFVAFFPTRAVSIDEQEYWANANRILNQELRQDCDPSVAGQFPVDNYCISKYNIGTSLLLLPAAVASSQPLAFLTTFSVFLLGVCIFYLVVRELGIDTIFTYYYALYPAFVYYSRTLFSEVYSATLILAFLYCLLSSKKSYQFRWLLLGGLIAGIAVLVRYTNAIPIAVLLVVWLAQHADIAKVKNMFSKLGLIALGGIPFLVDFLLLNTYVYGHPLRSGYYFSSEEGVYLIDQVPLFLLRYFLILNIVYPGTLALILLKRTKLTLLLSAPVIISAIFYAGFPSTFFEGRIYDLIFGLRFLVPVLPLILVLWSSVLNQYLHLLWVRRVLLFVTALLVICAVTLTVTHQQFLLSYSS